MENKLDLFKTKNIRDYYLNNLFEEVMETVNERIYTTEVRDIVDKAINKLSSMFLSNQDAIKDIKEMKDIMKKHSVSSTVVKELSTIQSTLDDLRLQFNMLQKYLKTY